MLMKMSFWCNESRQPVGRGGQGIAKVEGFMFVLCAAAIMRRQSTESHRHGRRTCQQRYPTVGLLQGTPALCSGDKLTE